MSQIDLLQTILISLLIILEILKEVRYRFDEKIKKLDKTINELFEEKP